MDIQKRSGALDQFRGLAILFMVFVNSIAQYPAVPAWLKHAKANGITFADFILPMFLFGIGWAGSFSFKSA